MRTWENELRYENPIVALRRVQLIKLDWKKTPEVMEGIFKTIPKNFRKIFMYEVNFDKAREKCGSEFEKRLIKCLKYCVEVIG